MYKIKVIILIIEKLKNESNSYKVLSTLFIPKGEWRGREIYSDYYI